MPSKGRNPGDTVTRRALGQRTGCAVEKTPRQTLPWDDLVLRVSVTGTSRIFFSSQFKPPASPASQGRDCSDAQILRHSSSPMPLSPKFKISA